MGFWGVVNKVLEKSDIVVLVGDARMPELSRNKMIEDKVKYLGKTLVIVFTKSDLLSEQALNKTKEQYRDAFFVSSKNMNSIKKFRRNLQIISKNAGKKNPQIGIVGYPNVGKSALINVLARRARAKVADLPGTTRGVQWINASGLNIIDSPGVIPYFDKSSELILLGSKHPEKTQNIEKTCFGIIEKFLCFNQEILASCYKIQIIKEDNASSIIEKIGQKRGFLKKGGDIDETKTMITIVKDWQKGKLHF